MESGNGIRGGLVKGSYRVKGQRFTPADGDDYTWAPSAGTAQAHLLLHIQDTLSNGTYDLRTGPERTQAQLDDLAFRLRTLEAQHSQEIRTLAERLQQVEHVLDQYTGDHR